MAYFRYRMTVLRNLPNLEKLDNVPVQPDEVQEAIRRGAHIPDSDDEGYPQQVTIATPVQRGPGGLPPYLRYCVTAAIPQPTGGTGGRSF